MTKKELILQILSALYNNNNVPTYEEFEISNEQYADILELMQDGGLIKYAHYIWTEGNRAANGCQLIATWANHARITLLGIRYLEENDMLQNN